MKASQLALAAAAMLAALPAHAQTAPPDTFSCSITVTYTPSAGIGEIYQHDFAVTAGGAYTDDTSTATREHRLSVTTTVRPTRVEIKANYSSDVSALAFTGTSVTLRMRRAGRAPEIATGRHQYYHSASGSYAVTYTFRCQKQLPAS